MKKSISTNQTEANITKIKDLLQASPSQLKQLSQTRSPEKLREPLATGERSFVENLAHLLNCEARTTENIYLALIVNEPFVHKIHPERQFGQLIQFEQFLVAELLTYFQFRRTVLMQLLNSLTDKQWSRTIREEGKKRQESVYWLAHSLALHELEHLTDLKEKLNQTTIKT